MAHRYPDKCKFCPAYGWRVFLPRWVGRTCPMCAGLWLGLLAPDGRIAALINKNGRAQVASAASR